MARSKTARVLSPGDGELFGFLVALDDLSRLEELITRLAIDSGTQPAYGRGMFRAMGAIYAVIQQGKSVEDAIKTPTHTTEWFDQLRRDRKAFQ